MNRLQKFAKFAALVATLLAVVAGALIWRDSARRDAVVAPLRAAGDPVSIADLEPPDVPAAENAATYLMPVSKELETLVGEIYLQAFPEAFDPSQRLSTEQLRKSREFLSAHPQVKAAITNASPRRQWSWPLNYEASAGDFTGGLLDAMAVDRNVARYHKAVALVLAAEGDADAAADTCLQGLRFVRLQSETPTVVASLVNIACQSTLLDVMATLLQHHPLNSKTHQAIEAELARQDSLRGLAQTLKSERAFGVSSFDKLPNVPGLGWVTNGVINYVEFMNEQITLSGKWPYQPTDTATVLPTGMTDLVVPAVKGARDSRLGSIAQTRCVRVLNAIKSRPATSDPLAIDALGLPAEAITDPFSGNSLMVKKTESSWTIYSVGPNGIDDDGQVTSDESASLDVGI